MNELKKQRLGATMVTVVIFLPVLFILAAMAINLAYIQVVNTKVQIVADAAARAAGRAYVGSGDEGLALLAAQQMAVLNPVQSIVVPIESTDLEYGLSKRDAKDDPYTFTPGVNGNSVRLTTHAFADGAGSALQPVFPVFVSNFDIRPLCTATNTQATLDVTVIVDRSGSMAFADDEKTGRKPNKAPSGWNWGDPVPPDSRWLDLVAAVDGFCQELTLTDAVEHVGLVSYSEDVTDDVNLTEDYTEITNHAIAISSAFYGGRTNVGGGIATGITNVTNPSFHRPWANKVLVLMSDGIHNRGRDPLVAAADAVAADIPVYTVSFSVEADIAMMQQIADMTGGTHYHAVSAEQLNEAFRQIARTLPSMLTQ